MFKNQKKIFIITMLLLVIIPSLSDLIKIKPSASIQSKLVVAPSKTANANTLDKLLMANA